MASSKWLCALFLVALSCGVRAGVVYTEVSSTSTLISSIASADLTVDYVSNVALDSRGSTQQGTFSNGTSSNFPIDTGVVLTTGTLAYGLGSTNLYDRYCAFGTTCTSSSDKINTVASTDPQYNLNGASWSVTSTDADLQALMTGSTLYDANSLSFRVQIPSGQTQLYARIVYASEEYHEWAGDSIHDVFGFWINGQNVATVSGNPISSSTINNGRPVGTNTQNSGLFIDNAWTDTTGTGGVYTGNVNIEYDGMTTATTISASGLTSGTWYDVKIGIADVGDATVDSAVFVESGSLSSYLIDLVVVQSLSIPKAYDANNQFYFVYNVTNNGPDTANSATLSNTLPAVFQYSLHSTKSLAGSTAGCTYSSSSHTLSCTLASLAVGDVWMVELWGTPASAGGMVENSVTVSAVGLEATTSDNTVTNAGANTPAYGWVERFAFHTLPNVIARSTYTPTVPEPRTYHTIINAADSNLYLFGGHTYQHPAQPNDVWQFSIADRIWNKLSISGTVTPMGRSGHSAVYLSSGLMYVFFGFGMLHSASYATSDLQDAYEFNTLTNTWTALAFTGTSPGARKHHVAVVDDTETVMYMHGGDSGGAAMSDIWYYTFTTFRWVQLSPTGNVPAARSHHSAAFVGGVMFICGGYLDKGVLASDLWSFDPSTTTWTGHEQLLDAQFENADHVMIGRPAVGSQDAYLLVYGGFTRGTESDGFTTTIVDTGAVINTLTYISVNSTAAYRKTVYPFSPADTSMPAPRLGHSAVGTASGLIVMGGDADFGESELFNDIWLYGDAYP